MLESPAFVQHSGPRPLQETTPGPQASQDSYLCWSAFAGRLPGASGPPAAHRSGVRLGLEPSGTFQTVRL